MMSPRGRGKKRKKSKEPSTTHELGEISLKEIRKKIEDFDKFSKQLKDNSKLITEEDNIPEDKEDNIPEYKKAKQLPRYVRCSIDHKHQNIVEQKKQHYICKDCKKGRSSVEYICRLCYEKDKVNLVILKKTDIGEHKRVCKNFKKYKKSRESLKTCELFISTN